MLRLHVYHMNMWVSLGATDFQWAHARIHIDPQAFCRNYIWDFPPLTTLLAKVNDLSRDTLSQSHSPTGLLPHVQVTLEEDESAVAGF